jgi:hypothetical protein
VNGRVFASRHFHNEIATETFSAYNSVVMPSITRFGRSFLPSGFLVVFLLSRSIGLAETNFSITIPARGLALIANHLINAQSNTVASLFPNGPEGLLFYKFDAVQTRWSVNQFQWGAWIRPNERLLPGEGAFVRNPLNTNLVLTFKGEPSTETNIPPRAPGYNLVSFPTPGKPGFGEVHDGDFVGYFDRQAQQYLPAFLPEYIGGLGWFPTNPPALAGESFFYFRGTPASRGCDYGSIYLNNYCPADGIDAPFELFNTCVSTSLVAQLYAGYYSPSLSPEFTMTNPVGPPIRLIGRGNRAYVSPAEDMVHCLPTFSPFVQLRFWDSRYGSNYQTAKFKGAYGYSGAIQMSNNNHWLYPPANLIGLERTPEFLPGEAKLSLASPSVVSVPEGGTAQFTALWRADQFQWQRQQGYNFFGAPETAWSDIPGATSNVLVIQPVTFRDRGLYRCLCDWNCNGSGFRKTAGYAELNVPGPSSLASPRVLSESNEFRFTLIGERYRYPDYSIERSYDLTNWTTWQVLSNLSQTPEIVDPLTNRQPATFYRVRLLSP